jgi:hypothetical protein
MLLSRIGKQVTQVGLTQPCLLSHLQSPLYQPLTSCFRRAIQKLAIGSGAGRTLYAKQAFGAGAIASLGFGISAFTKPKVLCEGTSPFVEGGGQSLIHIKPQN